MKTKSIKVGDEVYCEFDGDMQVTGTVSEIGEDGVVILETGQGEFECDIDDCRRLS